MTAHQHPPVLDEPAVGEPAAHHPPPDIAARLYVGKVMHARLKPVGHRFNYSVFSLLIDLDRLDEADRMSRIFSVNGRNIASFHEADHLNAAPSTLRATVDGLLAKAGLDEPPARVLLACYPRIFGYVFNPLSVFYAYDANGGLLALIYEVKNTFGERHSYVARILPGEHTPAGVRQERTKIFHVSPFIDMGMGYRFRMLPPGDEIRWRILETDAEGPLLSAVYSATARPLSTGQLTRSLLRIPFLTWKIVAGIHVEAVRLWLKGVAYRPRPPAPEAESFQDDPSALQPIRTGVAAVQGGMDKDRSA